mmetsp:Transcript_81970/g.244477  ORF Transcript_81970/g.244477 Transcript_81970/m.244477 type:complete len:279 (+) Transcript_81970:804-1640(+)
MPRKRWNAQQRNHVESLAFTLRAMVTGTFLGSPVALVKCTCRRSGEGTCRRRCLSTTFHFDVPVDCQYWSCINMESPAQRSPSCPPAQSHSRTMRPRTSFRTGSRISRKNGYSADSAREWTKSFTPRAVALLPASSLSRTSTTSLGCALRKDPQAASASWSVELHVMRPWQRAPSGRVRRSRRRTPISSWAEKPRAWHLLAATTAAMRSDPMAKLPELCVPGRVTSASGMSSGRAAIQSRGCQSGEACCSRGAMGRGRPLGRSGSQLRRRQQEPCIRA